MRVIRMQVVSCFVAVVALMPRWAPAVEEVPVEVRGFSGQVRGLVVTKGEENSFTFKVARVIRVWKGSKAKNPEALIDRTVRVVPRWVKSDRGKWMPYELHVAFIRKVEAGQEMTLELHNVEGPVNFQILELSGEQREWAKQDGDARRETGERESREGAARVRESREREVRARDSRERESREREERAVQRDRRPEERVTAEAREKDVLIRVLRDEIRRLHEENAELRRLLKARD